ncbi:MAG TPA: SpoIID/LytB domain-containing protein [Solirubrobacteraceae bacterium]|nr:SpoIID/LytB domain-containing protein [Solirubrobacteraceae bacterium]
MRRLSRPGLLALALAGAPIPSPVQAAPANAAPAKTVPAKTLVVTGAGDGHGVGMSQDGALGFAEHGYSAASILGHYYTGTTIGQAPAGAVVKVLVGAKVEKVPLEKYVKGVVAAEMPASWPATALQAQAIASRTYALTSHAGGSKFDVYDDTRSQVYEGKAAETPETNAAVAATAGQIVTYGGRPAITYFFASSGGMTEDVQNAFPGSEPQPWLKAVPDPYDTGPKAAWKLSMSFATASARLAGLLKGSLRGIEVLKRGASPRILTAAIVGSRGITDLSGDELASKLGLTDTWAYFGIRTGNGPVKQEPGSGAPAPSPAPPSALGATSAPGATPAPATATQASSAGGTLAG